LSVKSDKIELTDVNGIKISYDTTGITFKDVANTYVAKILWQT
jgi:hypothetical protein